MPTRSSAVPSALCCSPRHLCMWQRRPRCSLGRRQRYQLLSRSQLSNVCPPPIKLSYLPLMSPYILLYNSCCSTASHYGAPEAEPPRSSAPVPSRSSAPVPTDAPLTPQCPHAAELCGFFSRSCSFASCSRGQQRIGALLLASSISSVLSHAHPRAPASPSSCRDAIRSDRPPIPIRC
jgi:hypothetical protein